MKVEVLTSGYVSMDHIIKLKTPAKVGFTSIVENQSSAEIFYGGCSVNIDYELCKLGIDSMPLIRVGKDYESTGFKSFLEEAKVPTRGVNIIEEDITGYCYLLQDNNNEHITIFYPGAMDRKYASGFKEELFKDAKLGVITVASIDDNMDFFRKCQKFNIPIVFGMKDDMEAFPEYFLKEILKESKIIFTNEVECEIIKHINGITDIKELFIDGKVDILITTLGADGSICYIRKGEKIIEKRIEAIRINNVVDASGGGDAYMSGFLYGYLKDFDPEDCCRLGTIMASHIIQKEGCLSNVPDESKLLGDFDSLFKKEV
ncbi:carbohydrate kinase family protein [Lachnoanaerobaculum orale]|uniref:Carbohydrate kinase family protein n=1 Tax=Lachnoanaerobaculum orale TaxID=979627 RepID=A0A3P3Q347_9FIRM|nr:PfkB family carbohydrate kinase [Lachnoanaerobaculum orale]RRJ15672.1 carbohydrate kinase family protein [Lachnoanaerobaculum orale]